MFALVIVQGFQTHMDNATREQRELVSRHFRSTSSAMVSLFMATTGGADWGEHYEMATGFSSVYSSVYLFFIAFFTIVAWNTIMGTFTEKACRLAMPDLEAIAMEKHKDIMAFSKELTDLLMAKVDMDGDGMITLAEFRSQLDDHDVVTFFLARDINVTDAEDFFHMLASIHGTDKIHIKAFTKSVMGLRGDASSIDLQAFHFDMKYMLIAQTSALSGCFRQVEEILARLQCTLAQPNTTHSSRALEDPLDRKKFQRLTDSAQQLRALAEDWSHSGEAPVRENSIQFKL
jgi:hypothetical protein